MREPRSRATQGLQGKIDGQLKRPVVLPLGPCKSGLPDLRRLTADLGQARDRCLAPLARDTRVVRAKSSVCAFWRNELLLPKRNKCAARAGKSTMWFLASTSGAAPHRGATLSQHHALTR